MKLQNVITVHKKVNRSEEDQCILPNLSNVFERCIYKHMAQFN